MLVHPDERVPFARLLQFLEQGEHLARDCAKAQAAAKSYVPSWPTASG